MVGVDVEPAQHHASLMRRSQLTMMAAARPMHVVAKNYVYDVEAIYLL